MFLPHVLSCSLKNIPRWNSTGTVVVCSLTAISCEMYFCRTCRLYIYTFQMSLKQMLSSPVSPRHSWAPLENTHECFYEQQTQEALEKLFWGFRLSSFFYTKISCSLLTYLYMYNPILCRVNKKRFSFKAPFWTTVIISVEAVKKAVSPFISAFSGFFITQNPPTAISSGDKWLCQN